MDNHNASHYKHKHISRISSRGYCFMGEGRWSIFYYDKKGRVTEFVDSTVIESSSFVNFIRFDSLGRPMEGATVKIERSELHLPVYDTTSYCRGIKYCSNNTVAAFVKSDRAEVANHAVPILFNDTAVYCYDVSVLRHDSLFQYKKCPGKTTLTQLTVLDIDTVRGFRLKEFDFDLSGRLPVFDGAFVQCFSKKWDLMQSCAYLIQDTSITDISTCKFSFPPQTEKWISLHDKTYPKTKNHKINPDISGWYFYEPTSFLVWERQFLPFNNKRFLRDMKKDPSFTTAYY